MNSGDTVDADTCRTTQRAVAENITMEDLCNGILEPIYQTLNNPNSQSWKITFLKH